MHVHAVCVCVCVTKGEVEVYAAGGMTGSRVAAWRQRLEAEAGELAAAWRQRLEAARGPCGRCKGIAEGRGGGDFR